MLYDDLERRLAPALWRAIRTQDDPEEPEGLARIVATAADRCVVLDLYLARRDGLLVRATAEDRYEEFFDHLVTGAGVAAMLERYPGLASFVRRSVDRAEALRCEIRSQLRSSREALDALGGVASDSVDIEFLGDPHAGGRRTALVSADGGRSLVWKPRSAAIERMLAEVLDLLPEPFASRLLLPQVIDGDDCHWQLFVTTDDDAPVDDVQAWTYGAWHALGFHLGLSDLHDENMLRVPGGLVLVDGECSIAARVDELEDVSVIDAPLSTMVLPFRMGRRGGLPGLNFGFGGHLDSADERGSRSQVLDDGRDDLRLRTAEPKSVEAVEAFDLVEVERVARVMRLREPLVAGVVAAAGAWAERRDEIAAVLARHRVRTRRVLRSTQVYYDALERSLHPSLLAHPEERGDRIRGWLGDEVPPAARAVEVAGMLDNDVPSFWTSYDDPAESRALGLLSHAEVLELRSRRWAGDDVVDRHRAAVDASFVAYQMRWQDGAERPRRADADDPLSSLRDRMRRTVFTDPTAWFAVRAVSGRDWFVSAAGPTLYDGVDGVIVALLARADPPDEMRALASALVRSRLAMPSGDAALFSDGGGHVVATRLAAMHGIVSEATADGVRRRYVERVAAQEPSAIAADLLEGEAGTLLLLAELARSGDVDERHRSAVDRCLRALEDQADRRSRVTRWPNAVDVPLLGGLSHGVAGIAYACARVLAAPALGEALHRRARALGDEAWASQRALRASDGALVWRDERPESLRGDIPMNAWCHGADGVSLVLVERDEVSQAIADALATDPPEDIGLSLCHGLAGRALHLETLLDASTATDADDVDRLRRQADAVRARLRARIADDPVHSGEIELTDPSLMLGIGGILVALGDGQLLLDPLRMAFADQRPTQARAASVS